MNAAWLIVIGACLEGQADPRYYPLDVGNVWSYAWPENPAAGRREVAVASREGDRAHVTVRLLPADSKPVLIDEKDLFERAPARIEIDIPGEGPQPHYLFAEGEWTRRDTPGCDDGVKVTVVSRGDTVETPAGTFTGAVQLGFAGSQCADAGTQGEWWVPDVGLVKWVESSIAGPRTWVLAEFRREIRTYRRGDADGDGEANIADPVRILNWLGTGGPPPSCLKAADVDGSGTINITDPIFLLNFLFLGGPRPSEPFDQCGTAAGDEVFTCVAFDACAA